MPAKIPSSFVIGGWSCQTSCTVDAIGSVTPLGLWALRPKWRATCANPPHPPADFLVKLISGDVRSVDHPEFGHGVAGVLPWGGSHRISHS